MIKNELKEEFKGDENVDLPIDMSKVQTLKDVISILELMDLKYVGKTTDENYSKIKHLLK